MKKEYQLTICILHYRKLPQLKKTIANLEKYTQIPFKIKLLNQAYLDSQIRSYLNRLRKKENIEVIFNRVNNGCGGGREQLTQKIDTPYVMTLDDDIYVHKNWLKPVLKFLKENPEAKAVSFVLYNPDGKLENISGQYLKIDRDKKIVTTKNPAINPLTTKKKFLKIDNPSSGVMIFQKELLKDIKWDPDYFIGFDDLDIGMQFKLNPKNRCYLYLKSRLIHDKVSKQRKNTAYNKQRRNYQEIRRSYLHFLKKWGYRLPLSRHLFYKYICLLPNSVTSNLAYLWINFVRPLKINTL